MTVLLKKQALDVQKMQLNLSVKWIEIIEDCNKNIEEGRSVDYYKSVKNEAVEKYAASVTDFMGTVINLSTFG